MVFSVSNRLSTMHSRRCRSTSSNLGTSSRWFRDDRNFRSRAGDFLYVKWSIRCVVCMIELRRQIIGRLVPANEVFSNMVRRIEKSPRGEVTHPRLATELRSVRFLEQSLKNWEQNIQTFIIAPISVCLGCFSSSTSGSSLDRKLGVDWHRAHFTPPRFAYFSLFCSFSKELCFAEC